SVLAGMFTQPCPMGVRGSPLWSEWPQVRCRHPPVRGCRARPREGHLFALSGRSQRSPTEWRDGTARARFGRRGRIARGPIRGRRPWGGVRATVGAVAERRVEGGGTSEVSRGLVGAPQGLQGHRAVVIALGAIRGQRDAGAERGDGVRITAATEGADALVEV